MGVYMYIQTIFGPSLSMDYYFAACCFINLPALMVTLNKYLVAEAL